MDKFDFNSKPQTEYQDNLKKLSRSPIEMWLEDFTIRNLSKETVEQLGVETFDDFEDWKTQNNIIFQTNVLKLGVTLSNIQIEGGILKGRHTKKGKTKIFNIQIFKKFFNIGCLFDYIIEEIQPVTQ